MSRTQTQSALSAIDAIFASKGKGKAVEGGPTAAGKGAKGKGKEKEVAGAGAVMEKGKGKMGSGMTVEGDARPAKRPRPSAPPSTTSAPTSVSAPSKLAKTVVEEIVDPSAALSSVQAQEPPAAGGSGKRKVQLDEEELAFRDSRGARNRTEDGLPIYSVEELKIGLGGDTPLCPFDCKCCY